MSVEKDSNDAALTEGSADTTAELVPGGKPAVETKGATEKNELRIVLQVELRTDISEGAASKSGNKITVVNHQIRSVIHIIGGGDVEREGGDS